MYSKVYWIDCEPDQAENLMAHYDSVVTPAFKAIEHHAGHQMIEVADAKWLLISNYHSKTVADSAGGLVQDLVKPMTEKFGMRLDVITQGEVIRSN